MSKNIFLAPILIAAAIVSNASAQAPPPAVYKNGADLMAFLKTQIPKAVDQASSPIANESAYRINLVRRAKPGVAMAHATGPAKGTEVHYIIDGAATVVTGGALIRAAAGQTTASTIEGGETHHLTKGDVLVISAGTPHWYKEVEGSVTYLEVRFDVEKK
jgi:mannose-6-phosphate isomerase-like protein (cupin superfamily)